MGNLIRNVGHARLGVVAREVRELGSDDQDDVDDRRALPHQELMHLGGLERALDRRPDRRRCRCRRLRVATAAAEQSLANGIMTHRPT